MALKTQILILEKDQCALTAADVLKAGGTIIYPTETLYGIGALADNKSAINKIFDIKQRAYGMPLLTLVKDTEMISTYFKISDEHLKIYEKFNDLPLTIILNQKFSFPDELSAGTRKVGVRISSNEFVKELFEYIDVPLVSTSANLSGRENTMQINEIINQFKDKVDLIIDSGNLPVSKGSTILDLTTNPPEIVRKGDLGTEQLKEFLIGKN